MTAAKGRRVRENGEGSAYQMADGRWRAEVTIGWGTRDDGTRYRIRKYVYAPTKEEAKVERNKLLSARERGELPTAGRLTVSMWLDYWLDVICTDGAKPLTPSAINGYRRHAEGFIKPVIGNKRLDGVTPDDVEKVYRRMRAEGRAPSYINGCHRAMRRAFKLAMRRRYITVNPCDLIDAPTFVEEEADYFTPEEARAVLAQATIDEWGTARWSVALALGIRQSEALGLLRHKIAEDCSRIKIDRQLRRPARGESVTLARPKSQKSNREIVVPPPLRPLLRAHLAMLDYERAALGGDWRGCGLTDLDGKPVESELVFCKPDGHHVKHKADWVAWGRLLEAAGVRYINPHGSRHTAAVLMLVQGIHPRVAQEVLGHASPTLFMKTYSHVVDELHHDAAEKVGDALWGKPTGRHAGRHGEGSSRTPARRSKSRGH